MTEPAGPFKNLETHLRKADRTAEKTFTICLILLTPLLCTLLAMDITNPDVTRLIYIMIGLIVVTLIMTRAGFFRLSVPVMSLGLGLLATAAVFSITPPSSHIIYMLCVFHLFIIFTASLVSYNPCHIYLSSALALGSFALHYGAVKDRILPPASMDDYILCAGLVAISAVLINNTLAARRQIFRALEKSAGENAEKADQLSTLYRDLLRATEERKEMALKYKLILETASDAILIAQDGFIKFSNPRTLELFGYSWEELRARPFDIIIHQDDREMVSRYHQDRQAGKNPPPSYAFRAVTRNGTTLWLQIHAVTTLWEKRPAILSFIQDITHHKHMEQQIQQSQKMEAIGTLAGGIAHDFNNILSGIFAYLQLAENHSAKPEKLMKDLYQIRQGAEKAADLCRQILLISRKSEPKKESVALEGIVRDVLDLMKATLPATIRIRESIESGGLVHGNAGKLHQVVLNLCTNAFQAMADAGDGVLDISLNPITVHQDPALLNRGIPSGDYICLRVRDTGHGMDLRTQRKLFDPYFTTKPQGKGTGLGLAVTLGIVEDHKGYIRVLSEKDKGSEFQIFFPKISGRREKGDPTVPAQGRGITSEKISGT